MRYSLRANPFNPVEYLACCGIFEILTRFDSAAVTWWYPAHEACFQIDSVVDEESLLHCLRETLSNHTSWKDHHIDNNADDGSDDNLTESAVEGEDSDSGETEGDDGLILTVTFRLHDQSQSFPIDWWYETLKTDRTIKKKSGWKMYAGNQTIEGIIAKMTEKIADRIDNTTISDLTTLLRLSAGMSGRFGFDPRSTRNALETGYSPNDLGIEVPTYPAAELLACIGANYFFPPRTRPDAGITSARGWVTEKCFQYALWQSPLPLTLARMAAGGSGFDKRSLVFLQADRAKRDKYSNFKMARTVTFGPDGK